MSTTTAPVAAARSLTVRFSHITAVDEVSFAVAPGQVYALLGRNGAGKSTIVRCLLGQLKPTSGEITLCGSTTWQHRARLMERIAVVPETPDLPPDASATQVAALYRRCFTSWHAEVFEGRLERFGISRTASFSSLSKGQQKQLSLALALATVPEVLLLDDPTLGLDVVARQELYTELVDELAERGTTVIVTTHDLRGIEGIASHVGIIERGRLLLDEPLESLKQRCRRLRFRRAPETTDEAMDKALSPLDPVATRRLGGQVECLVTGFDEAAVQQLPSLADNAQLHIDPVSLEEIFIALCGEDKEATP